MVCRLAAGGGGIRTSRPHSRRTAVRRARPSFFGARLCLAARSVRNAIRAPRASLQWTRCWRELDSNLYGAFPVKWWFLVFAGSLFGAGKPFFVPSPAIRFAERAEGVKGPKR